MTHTIDHADDDADQAAEVTHPAWCVGDEPDTEAIHYTAMLDVEPDGPSLVHLSVQAMHAWPHPAHPDLGPKFVMVIEDEGEERHHFLPPSQVRELIESLQLLLGQVDG